MFRIFRKFDNKKKRKIGILLLLLIGKEFFRISNLVSFLFLFLSFFFFGSRSERRKKEKIGWKQETRNILTIHPPNTFNSEM